MTLLVIGGFTIAQEAPPAAPGNFLDRPAGAPPALGPAGPVPPGATTQPARGGRLPAVPIPVNPQELTDEKIGISITKGIDWLLTQFDPKTNLIRSPEPEENYRGGLQALAVLTKGPETPVAASNCELMALDWPARPAARGSRTGDWVARRAGPRVATAPTNSSSPSRRFNISPRPFGTNLG